MTMPELYDDNQLPLTIYSLVKQAVMLERSYKEMTLQSDEVDSRIQLWRDSIKTCKIHSESTQLNVCVTNQRIN
jgi:hypothetical protein